MGRSKRTDHQHRAVCVGVCGPVMEVPMTNSTIPTIPRCRKMATVCGRFIFLVFDQTPRGPIKWDDQNELIISIGRCVCVRSGDESSDDEFDNPTNLPAVDSERSHQMGRSKRTDHQHRAVCVGVCGPVMEVPMTNSTIPTIPRCRKMATVCGRFIFLVFDQTPRGPIKWDDQNELIISIGRCVCVRSGDESSDDEFAIPPIYPLSHRAVCVGVCGPVMEVPMTNSTIPPIYPL
ncbi:hypothetical protein GPALN_002317 [Globodera pallida]|nr:hypothetical protein GPALN_002317 [Globodera pallida]